MIIAIITMMTPGGRRDEPQCAGRGNEHDQQPQPNGCPTGSKCAVRMVEIFDDYDDGNVNNGHARGGDGHGDHDDAEIEDTTQIFFCR